MQSENTNLTAVLERAGLAVKLSIISTILSAVLSVIILLTGPVYEWAGFATYTLALVPFLKIPRSRKHLEQRTSQARLSTFSSYSLFPFVLITYVLSLFYLCVL